MSDPQLTPRIQRLPFDSELFSWQRFQEFCLDLAKALPEVKYAELYGEEGEKQRGIDIRCELDDGRVRTIQCRKRKRFHESHAEKLVEETEYEADEYEVWVTCTTGKAVSDFFNAQPNWRIRNAITIASDIRALPVETARRIVESGFGPQVRIAFLGGFSAFCSPGEFFQALDEQSRRIRHDLPLAGRRDELDGLRTARTANDVRVVLLVGSGGIGKTRVLKAFAQEREDAGDRVLFALEGAQLSQDAVDDLPFDEIVVVVDDAHRSEVTLRPLLTATARRKEPIKLVLGLRPVGSGPVEGTVSEMFEPHQVAKVHLGELPEADLEELAQNALGKGGGPARRLADASSNSPLITVLGGRLLRAAELSGEAGVVGEELRRLVLNRFKSEAAGRISKRVPEDKARELAQLVAALAPLNVEAEGLLKLVAEELDVPLSTLRIWLGELEEAGVVAARGRLRRIVPDMLADQFLFDACVDAQGRPTGRAEELWNRYGQVAGVELMRNLAEVDWLTAEPQGDLLTEIWTEVETRFERGDALTREQLIELVRPAAIHQPRRAMQLCRVAMTRPATSTNWKGVGVSISDADVRAQLPSLLRYAALDAELAPEALAMLWELGRDDKRETNPPPEHPIRVIEDLAEYGNDPGSRARQETLLELVHEESASPAVEGYHWSPLHLLSPLLSREGTRTYSRRGSIDFSAYHVSATATAGLRRKVRALLVERALTGEARQRVVAADLLAEALTPPRGYFGRPVPDEIYDSWLPDQLEILDAIEKVADGTADAQVRHKLCQALRWHSDHSHWADVKTRSAELAARVCDSDEDLVASILDPWGLRDQDEQAGRNKRVAHRLIAEHTDPADLAAAFAQLYDGFIEHGTAGRANPRPLMLSIAELSPDHARGWWGWVLENPSHPLAAHTSALLDQLRRNGSSVEEEARAALATGRIELRGAVASYLSMGAWFEEPQPWETALLEELVAEDDPWLRELTALTLLRLQDFQPELAAQLALSMPPGPQQAGYRSEDNDMLFGTLGRIDPAVLSPDQLAEVENKLIDVSELGFHAFALLANLSRTAPGPATRVLLGRLERDDGTGLYEVIPYHAPGPPLMEKVRAPSRRKAIRELVQRAAGLRPEQRLALGRVVWTVTVPGIADDEADDDTVEAAHKQIAATLQALEHCLKGDEPQFMAACEVLADMPWQIVLRWPEWVHNVLVYAQDAGGDRLKNLRAALTAAASSGGVGRRFGEDAERTTETLEASHRAAEDLPVGTPARELYRSLESSAREELERERESDEEFGSGWT